MKFSRAPASVRLMMTLGVLLAGISGCRVLPQSHPQGTWNLRLAPASPSVLVVITDPEPVTVMRATGALVGGTVRAGELVIILSAKGGAPLASGKAPGSPIISVPDPPVAPQHPTSFQRARYDQAVAEVPHHGGPRPGGAADPAARTAQGLGGVSGRLGRQPPALQGAQGADVGADLSAASSVIASMRQAGLPYGTPAVIAVMAVNQADAPMPNGQPASQHRGGE